MDRAPKTYATTPEASSDSLLGRLALLNLAVPHFSPVPLVSQF